MRSGGSDVQGCRCIVDSCCRHVIRRIVDLDDLTVTAYTFETSWTCCELELMVPSDTGTRFIRLWDYPDFEEGGPVQTTLREWLKSGGTV